MVFLSNIFQYIFYIFFFFAMLKLNLIYTFYFFFVSSLNYLWINLFYLCYFFFNFFFKFKIFFVFTFYKFFFINFVLEQTLFVETLLTTLISGTVLIHPIAFYYFTYIFYTKFFFYKRFLYIKIFNIRSFVLVIFLWLTLFLGGFWSTQSSSWGYFWVNDWVEWVLLIIILLIIVNFHSIYYFSNVFNFFTNCAFIINLLIFIRLGFISTRHNFIILNTSIIISILTFYLIVCIFVKNFKNKNFKKIDNIIPYLFLPLKYFFFMLIIKFLQFNKDYRFSYKYLHIFLFFFFFIWLLYFSFFFINYGVTFQINTYLSSYFNNIMLSNKLYVIKGGAFESLSFVDFKFNYYAKLMVWLSKNNFIILLNNYQLVFLFFFIFLVKLVEFRLLHKEKTYF